MNNAKLISSIVFIIFLLIVGFVVFNSTFITINAGEKGVLFKKFSGGLDKEHVYGQGLQLVLPWNDMIIYNVREQLQEEAMDVLSKDGLDITVDVALRYNPTPDKIGYLHDDVGENYSEIIIKNSLRSAARKVVGKFSPEELYSTKRDSIEYLIHDEVETTLSKRYISLQSIDIRSIKLPKKYEDAIQEKLVQEQEELKYQYRIAKERKEAERKRIEAQGIRDFQEIVSQGINEGYLKWKGIEATQELASSQNAKIVVIGGGEDGLPLILNQ